MSQQEQVRLRRDLKHFKCRRYGLHRDKQSFVSTLNIFNIKFFYIMKLKQFFLTLAAVLTVSVSFAQVGIGTNTPDPSSILDVNVDNLPANAKKGFLPPRMTSTQRDAISGPASGLVIYNITVNCLQWWNGSGWFNACTGTIEPIISGLTCASVTFNTLPVVRGLEYTGTATVPYTGGNGGSYTAGDPIASTGVTGLTATLVAGTLNNGNGNLTYTISGVPNPDTAGTATFSISFGTASCNILVPITNCVSNVAVVNDLISPTTGRRWMDRNLGAYRAATSSTDIMAHGDLYQYGRRTDGHQCRYSATTSTVSTTTSVPAPDTDKFIALVNWYSGTSPSISQLWNPTGTGVNEVCPSGYRVPTQTEWQAEVAGWNAATADADAFNTLKLTMGGVRGNSSILSTVNTAGNYQSSTAGSGVRTLNFTANTISTTTNSNFGSGRSVRCIKI
jgi:uncharacterized protein (TIGR02145 family)